MVEKKKASEQKPGTITRKGGWAVREGYLALTFSLSRASLCLLTASALAASLSRSSRNRLYFASNSSSEGPAGLKPAAPNPFRGEERPFPSFFLGVADLLLGVIGLAASGEEGPLVVVILVVMAVAFGEEDDLLAMLVGDCLAGPFNGGDRAVILVWRIRQKHPTPHARNNIVARFLPTSALRAPGGGRLGRGGREPQ